MKEKLVGEGMVMTERGKPAADGPVRGAVSGDPRGDLS